MCPFIFTYTFLLSNPHQFLKKVSYKSANFFGTRNLAIVSADGSLVFHMSDNQIYSH